MGRLLLASPTPEAARGQLWAAEWQHTEQPAMLWTIFSILIVAWIIGVFTEPLGGFVHVLLVLALLALATEGVLVWRRRHER
jgi:Flp pilus assembly protein TadB